MEDELYLKLRTFEKTVSPNEVKYYHVSSIENFIFHLKSIKDERSRTKTAIEIDKYIDLASQKSQCELPLVNKSKELFSSVWQLSDIYRYEVGFIKKPDYLIILFLVFCLFFLLKFSLTNIEASGISLLVFGGYALYGYLKTRAKKDY
jgi:hypothetical protein